MSNSCFLDPSLIVWDQVAFANNSNEFWEIPEYFTHILSFFDKSNAELIISQNLVDEFVGSFPAQLISQRSNDFLDFSRLVYEFLGNVKCSCNDFDSAEVNLNPDISNSTHFSSEISNQTQYGSVALASKCNPLLISYKTIWNSPTKALNVIINKVELKEIPVATQDTDLDSYSTALQRIYEFHPKHNQNAILGSPLPAGMNEPEMQKLLEGAVWSENGRRLCAHSLTFNLWIVFHRHDKNKFHGFPEELNNLTLKGFNINKIPSL